MAGSNRATPESGAIRAGAGWFQNERFARASLCFLCVPQCPLWFKLFPAKENTGRHIPGNRHKLYCGT